MNLRMTTGELFIEIQADPMDNIVKVHIGSNRDDDKWGEISLTPEQASVVALAINQGKGT